MERKFVFLIMILLLILLFSQFILCACPLFFIKCERGYTLGPAEYARPVWFCMIPCPVPSCVPKDSSQLIRRSVPQGDFVRDTRTPDEACNTILQEVKDSRPSLNCELIDGKRIDPPDEFEQCIDGASVAGCFACTFQCK
jgi:hypothetical protein